MCGAPAECSAGVSGDDLMANDDNSENKNKVVDLKKAGTKARGAISVFTRRPLGRWRAGRKFTIEAVTIPLADLSEAELAALESDPLLVCERCDIEASA